MIIRDNVHGIEHRFASPGVAVANPRKTMGNIREVVERPDEYIALLNVDLPFYLPLGDDKFEIAADNQKLLVIHRTKKRGQEEFSTLNTSSLPYFSHFQLQITPFIDEEVKPPFKVGEGDLPIVWKSYSLIYDVLCKFEEYLKINTSIRILDAIPRLSYRILYIRKGVLPPSSIAEVIYFASGTIRIRGPETGLSIDNEALRQFLTESIHLQPYADTHIAPTITDKPFAAKMFGALHDFCFYCRQHPKALNAVAEEQIRDLYLIVLKSVFSGAEGEAFHFDGKLDFKVVNPSNKYDIITGEFKWWEGESSARETYHQAIRKHATGQESEIYIVILNRNKDAKAVFDKLKSTISSEPEYVSGSMSPRQLPEGSREHFAECKVNVKGTEVPLTLGIADLYYANV